MAVNASPTPSATHATAHPSSAAAALASARQAKSRTGDEGGGTDFAAQLRSARDDAKADDESAAKDPATKDTASKDPAASKDDDTTTSSTAANGSGRVEPDAPPPQAAWTLTLNPALAALAARATGAADAAGALAAKLATGRADAGRLSALDDLKGAAANLLGAKAGVSAADALAHGLAAGDTGAANAATGTKDSLAAFLPQDDASIAAAAAATAGSGSPLAGLAGGSADEAAAPAGPAQATLDMPPTSPAFAPALGRQIEVWMKDGIQHAEVQLNPLDLGPIRVRIAIEGDTTRVQMAADVAATRDALQQAMPQLADALGQVGLSLGGSGVSDQPASRQSGGEDTFAAFADDARRAASAAAGRAGGGGDAVADATALAGPQRSTGRRGLLDAYA
jgi:flagellar hook-length control protein FliK